MDLLTSFDGTRIAWREFGSGPTVLLLHGFASEHAANWIAPGVVDALTCAGRRVVVADARGHGASDTPHDPGAYGGDAMTRDALAVIDHVVREDESVDVVGYSMGAMVAARVAAAMGIARDPRIRSLVVAAAGGDLKPASTNSGDGGLAAGLLVDDPSRIRHPVGRAFRRFADRSGADRFALAAIDQSTSLRDPVAFDAITVPTLVLAGADDTLARGSDALAARFPAGRARIVPGDHLGAVRDPAFAAAVLEFLAEVSPVGADLDK